MSHKITGRPKGSKTRPERRTPPTLVPTDLVSARVPAHVYAQMAAQAEQEGLSLYELAGKTLVRRWPCKCTECVAARRQLRKLRRDRAAVKVEQSNG